MTEQLKPGTGLLPCPNPWCRDNTPKLSQRGGHLFYVMCTGCGIKSDYEHGENHAIAAWNTRQSEPLLQALQEAREALASLRNEIADTEEHGDGAAEEFCPICQAIDQADDVTAKIDTLLSQGKAGG